MTVFWEAAPCSLVEIPLSRRLGSKHLWNDGQFIQRNIPEDSHLHTRRRENLKSRSKM
jgi:hypothetical protein